MLLAFIDILIDVSSANEPRRHYCGKDLTNKLISECYGKFNSMYQGKPIFARAFPAAICSIFVESSYNRFIILVVLWTVDLASILPIIALFP